MTKKVVAINSAAVRGRPFPPGNTAGRGRPKGSRNKAKSPEQALLDEYAPHLLRKCIALALQGDASALRMCMERLIPARRGFRIPISWPRMKTLKDVNKGAETVTQALRRGSITPTEGSMLMSTLESRSRIIARVPPGEEEVAKELVVSDPELAGLTDLELEQLMALSQKMERIRSGASTADAPPPVEESE